MWAGNEAVKDLGRDSGGAYAGTWLRHSLRATVGVY
jgi:hypothetical protein